MKTKKAVETHNSIIKAAEILFAEKSVSKVSVNEIVKKAGVAKGTFYLYFESKDDLVWHFVEHQIGYANTWLIKIARYGYSEADLRDIVKFIIQFTKRHMTLLKIMHNVRFYGFLGRKNMEEKYMSKWKTPVALWLEKGKNTGELRIGNPDFTALFMIISIHEMIDRFILEEIDFTLQTLEEELCFLLIKILK